MEKVLVVFTAKSAERIESEGGTSSWAISPKSLRDCNYVVCTRNTDPTKAGEFGNASPVPHGAAFLVGKMSGLEEVGLRNGQMRYRILLSEIAQVLVPGFWDGSRVPTRYVGISAIRQRGIVLESLKFRSVNRAISSTREKAAADPTRSELAGITIAEAKAGLAMKFGVSIEDIEIVIRG